MLRNGMRQRRFSRILGYARVSSVEQALGSSLDDQQRAMTGYATSIGASVARFFVESESGIHEKIERREQMRTLLKTAKAGDLVLCDKIDRWSRDPEFTYRTMRELRDADVTIYFVGDACDPSTPEGDTMLNFRVLFAKEEHKRIKQRLVGTRRLLRDRGLYVEGLPPWGYRRQDKKGAERAERNVLVIEPDEATQIKRAFKLCISGKPIAEVATTIGVKRDRVFDALHRRLYIGEIEDAEGAWIRGKHPPIVDAKTFQAAQDALAGRMNGSRPPTDGGETADWWLRDVATCGLCGAKMAAAYGGPKGQDRRHYFRCSKKCKPGGLVPVPFAEEQCDRLMWDRLPELRDELAAPLVIATPAVDVADLRARRAKLDARRAKYLEMHADGITSRDELRTQIGKLDAERMRLDALEVVEPAPSAASRREELRRAGFLMRAWMRMPPKVRRVVANRLLVSIGLSVAGDKLRTRPVWRATAEVDLGQIAEALLKHAPSLADDAASGAFMKKLLAI